jgi:hypothetical protein
MKHIQRKKKGLAKYDYKEEIPQQWIDEAVKRAKEYAKRTANKFYDKLNKNMDETK